MKPCKMKISNSLLCAFHVDMNFVNLRPDYIRAWLPVIAEMGYNAILWEVEDKVCWETCPDIVWPEAMSKTEFRSLLDDAAKLGLESIPLLQTIGHAEYVLKHDAYRHMRELPERHDCYCTENPATREFLRKLIREYLDLFGEVRRFHLGGDEAYVFGKCPVCAQEAARIGKNGLYAKHITELSRPLVDAGVVPAIWGDMILGNPEEMDRIPTDIEIWDWNYWSHGDLKQFHTADLLKQKGFAVVLCSSARSAGDSFFCPQTRLHDLNIAAVAAKAALAGLAGTCVTSWAIRLNRWETQRISLALAPRILANPEADIQKTRVAVASSLFGVDGGAFLDAMDQVSGEAPLFSRERNTAVQWNGLKDSLPAPEGHISKLIQKMRKDGSLEEELSKVDGMIDRIASGQAKLHALIGTSTTGKDLLLQWSQVAYFQYWQAVITREILRENRTVEIRRMLDSLKQQYTHFLAFDQTPGSACQNAGLVYDALIEHL